jgi:hypothetical protein
MSYLNRQTTKRRVGSPELVCLLVVLTAGVVTAWWVGQQIGMDLSSVTSQASMLGVTETGRFSHGSVGYTVGAAAAESSAGPSAPYCNPGQMPNFALGLSGLKQRLGDTMGAPVECEHPATANGDTIQQTTTGLAAYTSSTNTVSFTDGWRHWAITPTGFTRWEGTESDPPAGGQ